MQGLGLGLSSTLWARGVGKTWECGCVQGLPGSISSGVGSFSSILDQVHLPPPCHLSRPGPAQRRRGLAGEGVALKGEGEAGTEVRLWRHAEAAHGLGRG